MLNKLIRCLVLAFSVILFTNPVRAEIGDTVSISDFKNTSWDKALIMAVQTGARDIYFPKGDYRFEKGVSLKASGLRLHGEGVVIPTKKTPRLFNIEGNNNTVSLNIDGKNLLENAIRLKGNKVSVTNSKISNLRGFGHNSAIAIYIVSDGQFNVSNNTITDIYALGDGKGGNGIGMARGIAVSRAGLNTENVSSIEKNKIYNIFGEEGDSITLHSKNEDGKYGALKVNISNNIIQNFSRRAIKIQGSQVKIVSNEITNILDNSKTYNCSSAISVYTAIDMVIQGNHTKLEKCGSVSVYMNEKNPNLANASNVQIVDNDFETSPENDVSLLGVSVAGGQLKNLKISGNRAIGETKGFVIGRSMSPQISNNEIVLRRKSSDQQFIRTGDRNSTELSRTNRFMQSQDNR